MLMTKFYHEFQKIPLKRCLFPDMWLRLGLLSSWASGRGDLEALASGMYIKWNDITRDRCPQDVVEVCYSF